MLISLYSYQNYLEVYLCFLWGELRSGDARDGGSLDALSLLSWHVIEIVTSQAYRPQTQQEEGDTSGMKNDGVTIGDCQYSSPEPGDYCESEGEADIWEILCFYPFLIQPK